MNGVRIDERSGRYRVIRDFPNGRFAVVGIYGTAQAAVAAATRLVLDLED